MQISCKKNGPGVKHDLVVIVRANRWSNDVPEGSSSSPVLDKHDIGITDGRQNVKQEDSKPDIRKTSARNIHGKQPHEYISEDLSRQHIGTNSLSNVLPSAELIKFEFTDNC